MKKLTKILMKIIHLLKKKVWLIAILIFILAFSLRLIAAFKLSWRPDEIVYVDWIGAWFAKYFWAYFSQFHHDFYPPSSPVFGNPPLGMWLLSVGIWVAQKFGFSALIGARLINVLIGSISALLLFRLGSKWFNLRVGILAGLSFALLPLAITNNATAYLESILVILIIVQLDLILSYFKTKESKFLYYLGFALGLSVLVKLTIFILALAIFILIPIFCYRQKKFWLSYIIFLAITLATPALLWAGFRDLEHIKEMYFLYKDKGYSPFMHDYPFPVLRYYFLMIIGVLVPIMLLGAFFKIITFFRELIKEGFQKHKDLFLIVALLLTYLAYTGLLIGYSGPYQLLPVVPLVLIVSSLGLEELIERISKKISKGLILIGIIICLALPLTAYQPQFWGLYSSILVGKTNKAFELYPVGTEGEAIIPIAEYINQNTPPNARIAIMAYDWTLKKYLQDQRTTTPLFIDEGKMAGLARAADYLVIPRIFYEGNQGLTVKELLEDKPVESIQIKGIELARIYKVDRLKVHLQRSLAIGSKKDWQIKMINNKPKFSIISNVLRVKYFFTKTFKEDQLEDSRFILTNKHQFFISKKENQIVSLEIFGDGNNKLCSVILTGEGSPNYLYYDFVCDWYGWKKIYVPLSVFQFNPANKKPNFARKFNLGFGVLSKRDLKGQIMFRNVNFVELKK